MTRSRSAEVIPKDVTDTRWHCLEKPNMDNRNSQFNMRHAFATDFRKCHFNAAAIAHNPFVLDFLVFSAGTFPVTRRSKDFLAEKTALFRFEGSVVDRFRLLDFSAGPFITDDIVRGNFDRQLIKLRLIRDFFQTCMSPKNKFKFLVRRFFS